MADIVFNNCKNLRAYSGDTDYTPNASDQISFFTPGSGNTEPLQVWFYPADGYQFVRTENNYTDFINVHYGNTQTAIIGVHADGNDSTPSGCTLKWDSTFNHAGHEGAYLFTVTADGRNNYLWVGTGTPETVSIDVEVKRDPTHSITYDLENVTVSPKPDSFTEGDQLSLTFNPTGDWSLYPIAEWVNGSGNAQSYPTDPTRLINPLVFTPDDIYGGMKISAKASGGSPTPTTYSVVYNLSNVTVAPKPDSVTSGESYTLEFTIADGYEYDTNPIVSWYDLNGTRQSFAATDGRVTFTPLNVDTNIMVTASAIKSGTVTESYGIIRVYQVSPDNLIDLAKWGKSTGQDVDLTQYVSSLRMYFVPINSDATIKLKLGGYDTNISVGQIINDLITIDCGYITINGKYRNAVDYDSDIEFWLPFVGTVNVDASDVMDKEVHLMYSINTVNGDCVAMLLVDNMPVAYQSGNCSYEVPYNVQDNYSISSNLSPAPEYLMDLTPSAVVREPIMKPTDRPGDGQYVTVGDLEGFVRLDNFSVSGIQATQTELNMISNQLENGVIV